MTELTPATYNKVTTGANVQPAPGGVGMTSLSAVIIRMAVSKIDAEGISHPTQGLGSIGSVLVVKSVATGVSWNVVVTSIADKDYWVDLYGDVADATGLAAITGQMDLYLPATESVTTDHQHGAPQYDYAGTNAAVNPGAGKLAIDASPTLAISSVDRNGYARHNYAILAGDNVVATAEGSYADTVKAMGPVAYWRLGESSGTAAADEMGAHPGTYVNSPTLGATGALVGDANTAMTLSGTESATIPHAPVAFAGAAPFSVSLWSDYTPDASFRRAIAVGGNTYNWQIVETTTGIRFQRINSDGNDLIQQSAPTAGWHHAVGTYDGATMRMYINGVQVGTGTASTRLLPAATGARIGGLPSTGGMWIGSLDEVSIWDRALTAAEIALLYEAGSTEIGSHYARYIAAGPAIARDNGDWLQIPLTELAHNGVGPVAGVSWFSVAWFGSAHKATDGSAGAVTWITGLDILTHTRVSQPTEADTAWAGECARAVNAAIDAYLGVVPDPIPQAMYDEVRGNALTAGGDAYRRRDAPFGMAGYSDVSGISERVARDYINGILPQLDRWRTIGIA
jgi:hypothetical protein